MALLKQNEELFVTKSDHRAMYRAHAEILKRFSDSIRAHADALRDLRQLTGEDLLSKIGKYRYLILAVLALAVVTAKSCDCSGCEPTDPSVATSISDFDPDLTE